MQISALSAVQNRLQPQEARPLPSGFLPFWARSNRLRHLRALLQVVLGSVIYVVALRRLDGLAAAGLTLQKRRGRAPAGKGMEMIELYIAIAVVLLLAIMAVAIYNGLVQKRVRCEEAWSQIDVQLKRRYDLIPNLVETVKGYAAHERETLENVIQARNAAIGADGVQQQAEAENMLSGALRQLFALSEAYPNLKANQNFAQLQEELTSTENKIAFARQHYNDTVAVYNIAIQKFPNNMVAGPLGFHKRDMFEIEAPEQREAPKVEF